MKQTLYAILPLEDLVLTGNGKKKKKKKFGQYARGILREFREILGKSCILNVNLWGLKG